MGKQFEQVPEELIEWIKAQPIFFVASAPLSPHGSVNVSPKGGPNTFHLVSPTSCFYVDLSGSGAETSAHILEPGNARLTIMFLQLTAGAPNIVRLFGKGKLYERGSEEFERRTADIDLLPGARSIVWLDIHACTTACGYSVPIYEYIKHRPTLDEFAEKKERAGFDDPNGLRSYWAQKNWASIDGLPALGARTGLEFEGVERVDKILYRHQKRGMSKLGGPLPRPRRPMPAWLAGVPIGVVLALLFVRLTEIMRHAISL